MSTAPALRPLRWWDVPAVHALEEQLFDPDTWSPETFWAELAAPGRWYVLAERAGEVVGYAGLAASGAEADVQTVAVAPSAQGTGVGRVLLDALVAEAARRGAAAVLLEVRADNVAARTLYERTGFERIGVRRRYYQPGDVDAHVMRLRLTGSAERPPAG
ncbi:ribosomal protein S18-alanine N-acetyltransferase [Angustibacter speluncae]